MNDADEKYLQIRDILRERKITWLHSRSGFFPKLSFAALFYIFSIQILWYFKYLHLIILFPQNEILELL